MNKIDEKDIDAVNRVLRSGNLYRHSHSYGKSECDLFEGELSRFFNSKYSLAVSSGTNAIIAACLGVGVEPGDEVILPGYAHIGTFSAILAAGAVPVVANIDDSLSLCPEDTVQKISKKTKAIIAVHMNGYSSSIKRLSRLALDSGLFLIEDCSQSMGGAVDGKFLGTFGDIGCFSFNQHKILSCGEGGAIVTNNKIMHERAFYCHDPVAFSREQAKEFTSNPFLKFSMRLPEMSAALLRGQLSRLNDSLVFYRERKQRIIEKLKEITRLELEVEFSSNPTSDCGIGVRLTFLTQSECNSFLALLNENEIYAQSAINSGAHVFTSWQKVHFALSGTLGARFVGLYKTIDILSRSVIISLMEPKKICEKWGE